MIWQTLAATARAAPETSCDSSTRSPSTLQSSSSYLIEIAILSPFHGVGETAPLPVNMLSRQPKKGLWRPAGIVPPDGQGLGQGPPPRSILSGREEAGVPQPGGDQAVADRPSDRPVPSGRRRGRPGRRTGRMLADRSGTDRALRSR